MPIENSRETAQVERVICASFSLVQGSVMNELFLARNRLCSGDVQVSSALLYASGRFVCWAEGEGDAVRELLQRGAADPRNERQVVIHRSRGPQTLTGALGIATTQGASDAAGFGNLIDHFRREMQRGAAHDPADIWRTLVAPCALGPSQAQGHAPDRHVALVSAEDNGPIDLLRRLGERFGSRVVYQRFAGAKTHSSDVGLAYVDLRLGSRINRIHLLSRRALGHAMVRQSIEGLAELVMLMGSRPAAAIDLAASVADCVNAMARRPALCQVTDRAEVASTIGQLLQRAGSGAPLAVRQLRDSQLEEFLLGRGDDGVGVTLYPGTGRNPASGGASHGWSGTPPLPSIEPTPQRRRCAPSTGDLAPC